MNTDLKKVLLHLGEHYKDAIVADGRHYVEVSLADKAEALGLADLKGRVKDTHAVVPLKAPARGMKVRIDGRTFVNYGQLDSGIAVPDAVAREAGMPFKTYLANDSMILNFS